MSLAARFSRTRSVRNVSAFTPAGEATLTLPRSSKSCPPNVHSQTWNSGDIDELFLVITA